MFSYAVSRLAAKWVVAAAAALAMPCVANADTVRLYDHANQGGPFWIAGTDQPSYLSVVTNCFPGATGVIYPCWAENRVSSVYVPAYQCLTLYSDYGYKGTSRTYCGYNYYPNGAPRRYNIDAGFDNVASSSTVVGVLTQG
jgi:hypothetical protein